MKRFMQINQLLNGFILYQRNKIETARAVVQILVTLKTIYTYIYVYFEFVRQRVIE